MFINALLILFHIYIIKWKMYSFEMNNLFSINGWMELMVDGIMIDLELNRAKPNPDQ